MINKKGWKLETGRLVQSEEGRSCPPKKNLHTAAVGHLDREVKRSSEGGIILKIVIHQMRGPGLQR